MSSTSPNRTEEFSDYSMTRLERRAIHELLRVLKFSQYDIESIYEVLRHLKGKLNSSKLRVIKYCFREVEKKKPCWTLKHIAYALALLGKGSEAYNFMRTCFPLPSEDGIRRVAKNIHFKTGLNEKLLEILSKRISSFKRLDKACCVTFQEIALTEKTVRSKEYNRIFGYVDMGSLGFHHVRANRALVFMVNGLHAKWTQPIAYYFIRNTIECCKLKFLLNEIISALQGVGFTVLANVCDHRPAYQAVIEELCYDSQTRKSNYFFEVNNEKIYCLYDPCSLLISTRNTLFNYNIQYDGSKVAKWEYIEKIFQKDQERMFKMLLKIKKEFIYLDKYPKYKKNIQSAACTLSHKVAACLNSWAGSGQFPEYETMNTAHFVSDMNNLFDSFNGLTPRNENSKYRKSISSKSLHRKLWNELSLKISRWVFISKDGKIIKNEHPVKSGWLRTMKASEELWQACSRKGFTSLRTRSLNLDTVENLFTCIRYFNTKKSDLNCYQFVLSLKSTMLSDMKIPPLEIDPYSEEREAEMKILVESKLLTAP